MTVQQPWAWAIVHGGKDVENRTQAWSYRGPLAIHAGSRISQRGVESPLIDAAFHRRPHEVPLSDIRGCEALGAIIGVVDMVDAHWCYGDPEDVGCCKPWGEVEYVEHGGRTRRDVVHLVLENPRPLAEPIPARGRLGLWTPEDALLAQIREQVPA
ncbi:MAG TPA: hypothetical protein VGE38_07085 [Nocardioides sp.]|uniref:hypothetical protein n=1 Tax=Nocardioides sp. TaxID=35761 RepID=UPI002ED7CA02